MTDPLNISLPLFRVAGILVRLHLVLLLYVFATVLRGAQATPPYAGEALLMMLILFVSVLLHEFGHCFAARMVEGDADEILLWPLGGLAQVQVPNTPFANLVTAAAGPAVNLVICALAAGMLLALGFFPPLSPFYVPIQLNIGLNGAVSSTASPLYSLSLHTIDLVTQGWWVTLLARIFYVNWLLFLFNVLLVGFPLDGGRILQCLLWPRVGFHQATQTACYAGYVVAVILGISGFVMLNKDAYEAAIVQLILGLTIYMTCKQQLLLLESGALSDDSLFGYDFSQGYTSFERSAPAVQRQPRPSFWERWKQQREAKRRQKEEAARAAEEQRLDDLLAKVQAGGGMHALTAEEQRFLKQVAAKKKQARG